MNKNNPSDVLESWSSIPGRANVLILAPGDAPYVPALLSLPESDSKVDVLQLEKPIDGLRLLSRAQFSVVILDAKPACSGFMEVILAGLGQKLPPIFLFASDPANVPGGTPGQGGVRMI